MNRGSINGVTLNGVPVAGLQRLVLEAKAYVDATIRPRILVAGRVAARAMVAVDLSARVMVRGIVNAVARVEADHQGLVRAVLNAEIKAVAAVVGRVAPRRMVRGQTSATGRVVASATPRVLHSAPGVAEIAVTVAPVRGGIFTMHREQGFADILALITLNSATRRFIPYDEDAPLQRVMNVPQQLRLMTVY